MKRFTAPFLTMMLLLIVIMSCETTEQNLQPVLQIKGTSMTTRNGILSFKSPADLDQYVRRYYQKPQEERLAVEKANSFVSLQSYYEALTAQYKSGLISADAIKSDYIKIEKNALKLNFDDPLMQLVLNKDGYVIVNSFLYKFTNDKLKYVQLTKTAKLASSIASLEGNDLTKFRTQKIQRENVLASKKARIGVDQSVYLSDLYYWGGSNPALPNSSNCYILSLYGEVVLRSFYWADNVCDNIEYDRYCDCDYCAGEYHQISGRCVALWVSANATYIDQCNYYNQYPSPLANSRVQASGTVYFDNVAVPFQYDVNYSFPTANHAVYYNFYAPYSTTLGAEGSATISTVQHPYGQYDIPQSASTTF